MKTLPALFFLAALAALLFSPMSLELAASILATTGILTILAADYRGRASRELRAARVAASPPKSRSHLRLAA